MDALFRSLRESGPEEFGRGILLVILPIRTRNLPRQFTKSRTDRVLGCICIVDDMNEAEAAVNIELKTNGWGIDLSYQDAFGQWHETPPRTITAILDAMGADTNAIAAPSDEAVIVVRAGEQRELPRAARIDLESGETIHVEGRLPPDLPAGYHRLQLELSEKPQRLIVSPGKCWLPEGLRIWGWAVQLYAARSGASWGIGDFSDLARLGEWSAAELDAGMMLVNPLSSATPLVPQQASPYYPSSRRFLNPLWLHIEWIPGATTEQIPQLEEIARAGRALNSVRLIDRDKVFDLKMRALELLWLHFQGDPLFDRFCQEQRADLDRYAAFCALAEHHKTGWCEWPEQYRHPDNNAVALFAREKADRIRFHQWLQWLLDRQRLRCSEQIALMQDLPIGVDPNGADAWAWQDTFAKGVAVGAPPDEFNTKGQNWGLPPFIPHKLRAAGYEPFVQTIRAALRNAGGLRIDHVMGLFRLFWIPEGMTAAEGAYVRNNAEEMLAILALESERARACIVGEDLGTLEEGVREKLSKHRVLSYRLLWFEKAAPETYPQDALAAVTTHDLPTVAGLWSGSDLKKQHELHLQPNEESTNEICTRLAASAGLSSQTPIQDVITGAYKLLARTPSRILTAALEDAIAVEERPNIPATTPDQNPNWSVALPIPIEELMNSELPERIAAVLRRAEPSRLEQVSKDTHATRRAAIET
jgi:4-alpha-glucanotransferase